MTSSISSMLPGYRPTWPDRAASDDSGGPGGVPAVLGQSRRQLLVDRLLSQQPQLLLALDFEDNLGLPEGFPRNQVLREASFGVFVGLDHCG